MQLTFIDHTLSAVTCTIRNGSSEVHDPFSNSTFEYIVYLVYLYSIFLFKEMKTGSRSDICTLMFIVTLFMIAKIWKQPMHPPMDE